MSAPVRLIFLPSADTRGLDPTKYLVRATVERIDDKPLSEGDLAEIRAAFGVEAPAPAVPSKPAKGKRRSPKAAE
jgi:hypothetical protein